jgi:hypothetical protein
MKIYNIDNVLSEGYEDIIIKYNGRLVKLIKKFLIGWDNKKPLCTIKKIAVTDEGAKEMDRKLKRPVKMIG